MVPPALSHLFLRRGSAFACALCVSACGYIGILPEDGDMLGPSVGGVGSSDGDGGSSDGDGGSSDGDGGSSDGDGGNEGGAPGSGGAATGSGGKNVGGSDGVGSGGTRPGGRDTGGAGPGGGNSGGGDTGGASGGQMMGSGGEFLSGGSGAGGSSEGSGGAGNASCAASDAPCEQLIQSLVHRYSFDGAGTVLRDSVGQRDGTIRGTVLQGSGSMTFSGVGTYVDLPPGLISVLPDATFEIWFVWHGGEAWQKLFEFGAQEAFANPVNYLYVTPMGGGSIADQLSLAAGLRQLMGGDKQLRTTEVTETYVLTHVVLIADDVQNRLTFYKNGQWLGEREDIDIRLNELRDQVNRLGRSLFVDDPYFRGAMTEFRIYDQVLAEDAIEQSYLLGPDVNFEK